MKLEIVRDKHGVHMTALDSGRAVAHATGATPKDAARWLVHHVNRIANATEQLVIEMGLLTDEEVIAIAERDEHEASGVPGEGSDGDGGGAGGRL